MYYNTSNDSLGCNFCQYLYLNIYINEKFKKIEAKDILFKVSNKFT